MRYPAYRDIIPADLDTVDTGTTWILPEEVKNGERALAIGSPLRPLRANFLDRESSKKLPTNRFKYTLNEINPFSTESLTWVVRIDAK